MSCSSRLLQYSPRCFSDFSSKSETRIRIFPLPGKSSTVTDWWGYVPDPFTEEEGPWNSALGSEMRWQGTSMNRVQSLTVIFVANDEFGHVCTLNKRGIKGERRR